MVDPAVYLEKISAFSRMLRLEGLSVSPKETADASQILIALGMEDRERVKTALRTVYAKSREEQLIYDRVFDGFFLSEEAMRAQANQMAQQDVQIQRNLEQLQRSGQAESLSQDQQYIYASMPVEEREKLQRFMDKYQENATRNPDLYTNFIHSVFAKTLLEQQIRMEDAALGAAGTDPELGMLLRDISSFQDSEIPKAIDLIHGITRQINGELTAKRKRGSHSGKLDFRRTIRKGLETGGSFYRLQYKKKRSRRKTLVVVCDVSGSMMQFSEFALRFIQNLNQVSESTRIFLFSEDVMEADAFSLQNMDLFREHVRQSGLYGKGTDLGKALEKINSLMPPALNDASTLLILSDTKTVDQNRALDALTEATRKAGNALWLNPIPQSRWEYSRTMQLFAQVCPMVACNTLTALAAACKRLTR